MAITNVSNSEQLLNETLAAYGAMLNNGVITLEKGATMIELFILVTFTYQCWRRLRVNPRIAG
jgi:hypothetical protein